MRTGLHTFMGIIGLCTAQDLSAQTLTEGTSIPPPGTIESHTHHYWATPGVMATSGTGNTWDASGALVSGTYTLSMYHAIGDSPYAADHPAATFCAYIESNAMPNQWWHWHITPSLAELVGVDNAPYDDPQTLCEFPFDLGSSFSDTYQAPGSSLQLNNMEYVASGEIAAPWGTIPNVVMFAKDGGSVYVFYRAENMLLSIGSYTPGFGLFLSQVVVVGIDEHAAPTIGIWPVPASNVAQLVIPFEGGYTLRLLDQSGRAVRSLQGNGPRSDLSLEGLVSGVYTIQAEDAGQGRCSGRLVIE